MGLPFVCGIGSLIWLACLRDELRKCLNLSDDGNPKVCCGVAEIVCPTPIHQDHIALGLQAAGRHTGRIVNSSEFLAQSGVQVGIMRNLHFNF